MLLASAAIKKLAARSSARERMVLRKKILLKIGDGRIIRCAAGSIVKKSSTHRSEQSAAGSFSSIPPENGLRSNVYFFAFSKRLFTSAQFTTFHQAAR